MAINPPVILVIAASLLVLLEILDAIDPYAIFTYGSFWERFITGALDSWPHYVLLLFGLPQIWFPYSSIVNLLFLPVLLYNVFTTSLSRVALVLGSMTGLLYRGNLPPFMRLIKGIIRVCPYFLAYALALVIIGNSFRSSRPIAERRPNSRLPALQQDLEEVELVQHSGGSYPVYLLK